MSEQTGMETPSDWTHADRGLTGTHNHGNTRTWEHRNLAHEKTTVSVKDIYQHIGCGHNKVKVQTM